MTPHIEPGLAMDRAVGRLIGHVPERFAIVTSDGGKSCYANVDRINGPWYCESQLRQWLKEQQSTAPGRLADAVIDYWYRWPHYSTDLGAAWQAAEWLVAHGWRVEIRPHAVDQAPGSCGSAVATHVTVSGTAVIYMSAVTRMSQAERPAEAICRALLAALGGPDA